MFSRRSTAPKPSDSSVHGSERSSRSGSTGHAGTPTTDSGGIIQNVTSRYLKKESLQALLEDLFPEQTDFKIRQREDLWCFTAPRKVEEVKASPAQPNPGRAAWSKDVRPPPTEFTASMFVSSLLTICVAQSEIDRIRDF